MLICFFTDADKYLRNWDEKLSKLDFKIDSVKNLLSLNGSNKECDVKNRDFQLKVLFFL